MVKIFRKKNNKEIIKHKSEQKFEDKIPAQSLSVNDEAEIIAVNFENKTLGAIYRQKRQEADIDIAKASNFLKVRPFDLNAIENNEVGKISKNIYAPGLIRSYGRFLKIDEKLIEEKIRECAFRSNTENKKHILVNIGEHLALTPKKELLVNSLAISVFLLLAMFITSNLYRKKLISLKTDEILTEIVKIEK